MNILLSVHEGLLKKKYFSEYIMADLGKLGKITENTGTKAWTESELSAKIKGMDICITHWGSPAITEKVLENAGMMTRV